MASNEKADPGSVKSIFRRVFSFWMIAAVWVPVAAITALHYGTSHEYHWVHDILRRAYYLPIVTAALRVGLIGGLASAIAVTFAYLPHAFFALHHFDPARTLEKVLEIVLYFGVAGVAGYLSDLERKRRTELQESLNEQKRLTGQLVRAGRLSALGEVVAGIAHEIKNPLHSLSGTAEIVDPLIPKDADERRMWEIHCEELKRLGRVADRFLSFANPAPIQAVTIDLRDVATRLVELVSALARQKNIDLSANLPEGEIMVQGDLDQLAQIGLNIAVNGIKAIGDNSGKIEISLGRKTINKNKMAFLEIANNGPRIPEKKLENLFDPFISGNKGTGLGLSISSRIAEQHGGHIEVKNSGLGVIFTLYLATA